jgi:hypothetical protein
MKPYEKLVKAGLTRRAIREIGYDLDRKGGFVPVEQKETKEVSYKLLEPEMIWEVVDPKHRQGKQINKIFHEWRQSDSPLSFLEYVEHYRGTVGYYEVYYIPEEELPRYRVQIGKPETKSGSKLVKGGASLGTENALSVSEQLEIGWEIYVQDMKGNIYSGPALDLKHVTLDQARKKVVRWDCPFLHHSSFLHGSRIGCAGEWKVQNGKLISISALTGHYKTPSKNFKQFLTFLRTGGVNLGEITVKWPWRTMGELDVRYYNGRDFLNSASAEYLQPPMDGRGIPIKEVWPHNQPNNYRKVTRYNFFLNKDLIPAGGPKSFHQFKLDETDQVMLLTYYYDLKPGTTYKMEWRWYDPSLAVVTHETRDYQAERDDNSTIRGLQFLKKQNIPRGQFICQHWLEGKVLFATHFSMT